MSNDSPEATKRQPQPENQPSKKDQGKELSDDKLDKVTGGFNPQPDPPARH
jgi:bacteriocin-like protein